MRVPAMTRVLGALALLVATGCGSPPSTAPTATDSHTPSTDAAASPDPGGSEPAFDGSPSTLAQWRQAGPGSFELVDDAITSRGGMGLLWYPERVDDVRVTLQWRTDEATDNSGVFVGLGDPDEDMLAAMRSGHEVQIYDADTGEPQKTGAIYGEQAPRSVASRPPGAWNDLTVTVRGATITVRLNDTTVNVFEDPDGDVSGYVGLQNHSDADEVSFRDVRIEPLAS